MHVLLIRFRKFFASTSSGSGYPLAAKTALLTSSRFDGYFSTSSSARYIPKIEFQDWEAQTEMG